MNDIKITSRHDGELLTYTDATNKYEVTICNMGEYYCGWYFVDKEKNDYQGKIVEGSGSFNGMISLLILWAREDDLLGDYHKNELVTLLYKIRDK